MRRPATALLAAVIAVSVAAASARGQDTDGPTSDSLLLVVHVRNGTTGEPAADGLPVEVAVMSIDNQHSTLSGTTAAGGVATFTIPRTRLTDGPLRCAAGAEYAGYVFYGEAFIISARHPAAMTRVTIYEPVRQRGLPHWSYLALAAIFLAAVGLVAVRRSDRRLD